VALVRADVSEENITSDASQKTTFFIAIAVKTSVLTNFEILNPL
jgi:hypothetical protein